MVPVQTKDFPRVGEERPSRGRRLEIVKVVMSFSCNPNLGRARVKADGPPRLTGLTKVLAGLLSVAVLHHPSPTFGTVVFRQYSAVLEWNPSPSPAVAGYHLYYGTASGNYTANIEVGNVTTMTVFGLSSGVTYYFAMTAYDTNGAESGFSNEASFMPGIPTVQMLAAPAGQAVLTVSGLIGSTYDIEATQDFTTWTVIGTVTLGASGTVRFVDADAVNFPHRFYRTQEEP